MTNFEVDDRVRWRGMEHLGEGRVVEDTWNLTRDGETGVHFPTYAAYYSDDEYHAIPEDELVSAEKGHWESHFGEDEWHPDERSDFEKVADNLVAAGRIESHSPVRTFEGDLDEVNRPPHYNFGRIEVWDFIYDQGLGYALGNAVKYITRAGKKDPETTVQDLRKAIAFLEREIRFEETGE